MGPFVKLNHAEKLGTAYLDPAVGTESLRELKLEAVFHAKIVRVSSSFLPEDGLEIGVMYCFKVIEEGCVYDAPVVIILG